VRSAWPTTLPRPPRLSPSPPELSLDRLGLDRLSQYRSGLGAAWAMARATTAWGEEGTLDCMGYRMGDYGVERSEESKRGGQARMWACSRCVGILACFHARVCSRVRVCSRLRVRSRVSSHWRRRYREPGVVNVLPSLKVTAPLLLRLLAVADDLDPLACLGRSREPSPSSPPRRSVICRAAADGLSPTSVLTHLRSLRAAASTRLAWLGMTHASQGLQGDTSARPAQRWHGMIIPQVWSPRCGRAHGCRFRTNLWIYFST
jgi:hypothetical protein